MLPRRLADFAPPLERLAAAGLGAYALFFAVAPLKWQSESDTTLPWSWAFARALYSHERLTERAYAPVNNAVFVALGLVPVVAVYLLQLRAALRGDARRPLTLRAVLLYALAYGALMFFAPRLLSSDVFSYIAYGRLSAVYHANPLVDSPELHPDALLDHIGFRPFRYVTSAYGPVWLAVSHLVTLAVEALGGAPWLYEAAYKLLALGCHLGCAAAIWAVLGRVAPERRVAGTVLYAWNPLMLAETSWNAHNDVLVLLLVLLAALAYVRGRPWLGLAVLALSVPVKWVTALAVPLYLAAFARQAATRRAALRRLALGAALAAAVAGITFVPYWRGARTFDAIRNAPSNYFTTNSLADLVLRELRWREFYRAHPDYDPAARAPDAPLPPDSPEAVVKTGLEPVVAGWERTHTLDWSLLPPRPYSRLERVLRWLGAAALLGVWGYWLARARDFESMTRGWGWSFFAYAAFAAVWFWPWYLVWVLGVCALPPWGRLGRVAAMAAVTGAMAYFAALFGDYGHRYRALFVWGPPLGYLAVSAWRARAARAG